MPSSVISVGSCRIIWIDPEPRPSCSSRASVKSFGLDPEPRSLSQKVAKDAKLGFLSALHDSSRTSRLKPQVNLPVPLAVTYLTTSRERMPVDAGHKADPQGNHICQRGSAGYVGSEPMSMTPERFLRGVVFSLVIATVPSLSLAEGESLQRPGVSKHMSDAILAGFRKYDGAPLARADETPTEVDPEVVVLPEMRVSQRGRAQSLDESALKTPTEAIPLRFGTGIKEVRGRKFTALTQKVLFIPIGFKLAW